METLNGKHGMLSSKEDLVEFVLELQEENQRLSKQIEKLQERPNRPGKDRHNSSEAASTDQKAQRVKGAEGEGPGRAGRRTLPLKEKLGLERLIGESPVFLAEIKKIPLVAQCDASVLISGETGTGKGLCARAIHYLSLRSDKPFVPVNCGAIPVELVENELFGHERGAFTGASALHSGLLREAEGGTLFLDDIDALPIPAQVKVLQFLQEKKYRPLGSAKMRDTDVRVIAATNIDLEAAVSDGKLRRDLYCRLNVIPLLLPPLRERRDDIPRLARYFLADFAAQFRKPVTDLSPKAMQLLRLYDWPGNVRELQHVIERAVALSKEAVLRRADIVLSRAETTAPRASFQEAKAQVIAQFERAYLQGLLLACQGNISQAAQVAQKDRGAFKQLLRKHRIDGQSFKLGT